MRFLVIPFLVISTLSSLFADPSPSPLATGFLPRHELGQFWAMANGYRASFDASGIHLVRAGRHADIRFPGADLRWVAGGAQLAQVTFLGETARSFTGREFLRAEQIYPGVDLLVTLQAGHLKSEFQLAAGVAPALARYCYSGAKPVAGPHGLV